MSSARSDSSPFPRITRGRGGGSLPQLVRQQWSSTDSNANNLPTPPGRPVLRRVTEATDSTRTSVTSLGSSVRGIPPRPSACPADGRGRGSVAAAPPSRGPTLSLPPQPSQQGTTRSPAVASAAPPRRLAQRSGPVLPARTSSSSSSSIPAVPSPQALPSQALSRSESSAVVAVRSDELRDMEDYVTFLETEREAMRRSLLSLRNHLADRQLRAEALELENRELTLAQLQMQSAVMHSSMATMTEATEVGGVKALPADAEKRYRSSPPRSGGSADPSPPISPGHAPALHAEYTYVSSSNGVEQMHDLPLHPHDTSALRERLAEAQRVNEALRQEVAEQKEELQRLRALERTEPQQTPMSTQKGTPESIQVGPTFTPPTPAIGENSVETFSLAPQRDSPALLAKLRDAQAQIDDLRDYIAELQRQLEKEQKLAERAREMLQEQLSRSSAAPFHSVEQSTTPLEENYGSLAAKLRAMHAMSDEDARTIAQQQEEIEFLQDQLAEKESEVISLKQDLTEAKRYTIEAAQSWQSEGEVPVLKDRIAEQDVDLHSLKHHTAKPKLTTPHATEALNDAKKEEVMEVTEEKHAQIHNRIEDLHAAQDLSHRATSNTLETGYETIHKHHDQKNTKTHILPNKQSFNARGAPRAARSDAAASASEPEAEVQALREQLAEQSAEIETLQQELAAARAVVPTVGGGSSKLQKQLDDVRAAQEAAARERAESVARRDAAINALREQLAEQATEASAAVGTPAAAKRAPSVGASDSEAAVGGKADDGVSTSQSAADAGEVAALRRVVDELRFHDTRRRNFDATKPTTVTRHHREFGGDEWGAVAAERPEALKDAFCCDAANACHVSRSEIIAVSFRVGSLHVDFSVRHNQDVSEEEIDKRIEEYDFPLVMALYADRHGPKNGMDAVLAALESEKTQVQALLEQLAAVEEDMLASVGGRSAAVNARLALLRSRLVAEEVAQVEAEALGETEEAAARAVRADQLRSALAYAEAATASEGSDVDAMMEQVEEHVEGVQSLQREIASRDEAVTALQEALVLAKTAAAGSCDVSAAAAATRTALLAELRRELAAAHGERARKLRRAIADLEALAAAGDDSDAASEKSGGDAALKEELAKQLKHVEVLQQELQQVRAGYQADVDDRGAMLEIYALEVKAMQEQLSQAQAAEDAARLDVVVKEHQWKQESQQQLEKVQAQHIQDMAALSAEWQRKAEGTQEARRELAALHEALNELRWYDERRDNCVKERPVSQSYLHRVFEGDGWRCVAQDHEEELLWMLHIDCSRACHVNLEHIFHISFMFGSLHVDFCVEHNSDVAKSELRDRLAVYPFPATWGLYHRVLEEHGPVDAWFVPSSSRAAEKLMLEEAVARAGLQNSELEVRLALSREVGSGAVDLLHSHLASVMAELGRAGQECTDNLERLEECAALLEEARESERELRDRLFAAAEENFELRRQHDAAREQWEKREESSRSALGESAARVAGLEDTIQRQADAIVELQTDVSDMTEQLVQRNAEMTRLYEREAGLLRKMEASAAEYAEVIKQLDRSRDALETAAQERATLTTQLRDAQADNEALQREKEVQAEAHRAEVASLTAEQEKLREGTDVLREYLPQMMAAASGQPVRSGETERGGAATGNAATDLRSGQLNAEELRDALLRHLSHIEQLRRDKESFADDLDAVEKKRNEYLSALERASRTLAEERTTRLYALETYAALSQDLLQQVLFMRKSEEDDAAEEGRHEGEAASTTYEPSSLRSATPPY
ncbi:hypothetical protein NQL31_007595 [Lotmaria passim]